MLEYEKINSTTLDFYHTGVPVSHRGQGIAKHLVQVSSKICRTLFKHKILSLIVCMNHMHLLPQYWSVLMESSINAEMIFK